MSRKRRKPSPAARKEIAQRLLDLVLEERATVQEDIAFLLSNAGLGGAEFSFDEEGLLKLEEAYRKLAAGGDQEEIETFERKLSIFLGETMINIAPRRMTIYLGSEPVISPVVVKLEPKGLHSDVFGFCSKLYEAEVIGHRQGRALAVFMNAAPRHGFE